MLRIRRSDLEVQKPDASDLGSDGSGYPARSTAEGVGGFVQAILKTTQTKTSDHECAVDAIPGMAARELG